MQRIVTALALTVFAAVLVYCGVTPSHDTPEPATATSTAIVVSTATATATATSTGTSCSQVVFADVQPILTQHCVKCHVTPGKIDDYTQARQWATEISRRVNLTSNDPQHMPLGTEPPLSPADRAKLTQWVTDGSNLSCQTATAPFLDLAYVETAIQADLSQLPAVDQHNVIYLVTAHAVDAGLPDTLVTWGQAINKTLNSVNEDSQDVTIVQPVDAHGAVWRVDLRSFGLGANDVAAIEAADPFNVVSNTTRGKAIQQLTGRTKPWYHADNFMDICTRAPGVYYQLVKVPATLAALQAKIGVDFNAQLAAAQAYFLGSSTSSIAEQKDRLLVRAAEQSTQNAYYWQSFDINQVALATKNLFSHPLIDGTGGVELFTPDASEVIYIQLNGSQAYALFDAVGNRLDFADPNVVRDTRQGSPSSVINNANSCPACHNAGLIPMVDSVRAHVLANASQFNANDVALVQALYKGPAVDNAVFLADNRRFATFLAKLGINPASPDPTTVVTDRLRLNWDAGQSAAWLLLTPAQFATALNSSATARQQIGQLLTGGTATYNDIVAVFPQLIADARLFQDQL